MPLNPGDPIEVSREEVKFYFGEIDSAEKRMVDEFKKRNDYENLIRYYEGFQDGKVGTDKLAIIDELSPGINAVIKTAVYQNPSVSVKSGSPVADGMVRPSLQFLMQNPDWKPFSLTSLMEGAIKWGMEKGGAKEALQLGCFDILTAGFTCIEVNIESQATYGPKPEAEVEEPNEVEPQGLIDKMVGGVKSMLGLEPKTPDEVDEKLSNEQALECTGVKDQTYWKRWRPDHILFDPRAEVFSESRFVAKVVRKSYGEFKKMYPQFATKSLPGETLSDISYASTKADKDRKAVNIYELQVKKFDQESGETYIQVLKLVRGIDEAIESSRMIFNTNGFTIKYGCLDKYGKLYPISRMKKAKKSQDDLNNLATVQMEHATRSLRKVAYDKNAFDADGINSLKSSDVFALVPKNRPGNAFESIPVQPVTTDNPVLQETFRQTINKHIGANELSKSGQSDSKFATQDQLQNQAFEAQISQVQDAIGDVANECIDCTKDIVQQLWDDEMYFKVTGIQGATAWYDPAMGPIADLAIGDYQAIGDIISAAKPNPMKTRNDALQFAQFITSPEIQMYLQARNKMTNLSPIENVIKQFDFDPDTILEDLPIPPQIMPNQPTQPGDAIGGLPQNNQPIPVPSQAGGVQ